jgi:protein-S-isoprenylcysteine O-methyltransferase Ste14
MHKLELKIPPPVVALLIAAAMWGLVRGTPTPEPSSSLRMVIAITIALVGAGFDIAGLIAFRRARTTVNPLRPEATSAFVRSGVYRYTRNPMYVGLAMLLLAWTTWLWSAWALVGPLAFILYISRFQIAPEEKILARKFGSDFTEYCAKVRRWL